MFSNHFLKAILKRHFRLVYYVFTHFTGLGYCTKHQGIFPQPRSLWEKGVLGKEMGKWEKEREGNF